MSKLAKYKNRVGNAGRRALAAVGKTEKLGSAGHTIVEFGTHAVLALASANAGDSPFGLPVKPDVAGALAAGLATMFGKGKTRKLGMAALRGAGHAMITRWVATKEITLTSGPDGKVRLTEEERDAA